jgi:pyruvate dehydrogenase E2 component (dihydrolipoamide acetyltransferase)
VIAIDLPGHGGSSKDVGDGSLSTLATAVGDALAAAHVTSAHLVGHSLGAAVAARLALDRPKLAASLTLISPPYLPGGVLSKDFLEGVAEAQRAKDLKPWLERLTADPSMITKDMVEDLMKFKRLDGAEEALLTLRDRMTDGRDAADMASDAGRLTDVLVIASKSDLIVGAPDETRLPQGWRVVWMERSGHMPHLEEADQVNALLLDRVG